MSRSSPFNFDLDLVVGSPASIQRRSVLTTALAATLPDPELIYEVLTLGSCRTTASASSVISRSPNSLLHGGGFDRGLPEIDLKAGGGEVRKGRVLLNSI